MKNIFNFLIALLLLNACKEISSDKNLPSSTGRFNELIVVIPQNEWEGEVGQALKEVLTKEVLGLPQPEPQFSIIRIEPKLYDKLLARNRNILIFSRKGNPGIEYKKDVNAFPQAIIYINGNNTQHIIDLINTNAEKIITTFKKSDLGDLQKNPPYPIVNPKKVKFFEKQKLQLNIPNNFKLVEDKDNFLWYRNETYNPGVDISGSMNIIAYTVPYGMPFKNLRDSIVSIRDKIGQIEIPGPKENTYMITEAAYTPHIFDVKFKNYSALKTLGKWEIKNGFMAGPFINYTIDDKPHSRLVVVEGFVYAPSVNKRDYMFELEAILNTLSIQQ